MSISCRFADLRIKERVVSTSVSGGSLSGDRLQTVGFPQSLQANHGQVGPTLI
jgi:hypothetical protein